MTQSKPITLLFDSKAAAAEVAFLLRGDQVEGNDVIFLNVADEKELLIEVETVAKLIVKCKFCFMGESCTINVSVDDIVKDIVRECYSGSCDFPGLNLVGAEFGKASLLNLNSTVLAYINLRRSNLAQAKFTGLFLEGANFSEANLEKSNFSSAQLFRADLSNANFQDSNLELARMREANLNGANLKGADLNFTNLENANLRGANLQGVRLYKSNLKGADLTNAVIDKATLDNAYLKNTILPNGKPHRRWHQPIRFVQSLLEPKINFSNLATLGSLLLYGSVANRVEASLLEVLKGFGSLFFYWILFLVAAIIPRIISRQEPHS